MAAPLTENLKAREGIDYIGTRFWYYVTATT